MRDKFNGCAKSALLDIYVASHSSIVHEAETKVSHLIEQAAEH